MNAAPARLTPIDGLRAVAMTMVVAQHCKLNPSGWTGVWLFYVISGFVICRTFLGEVPASQTSAYHDFIRRRFFRIVPLYTLYLAIGMTALLLTGRWGGFHDMPFLLTFTYNWQMIFALWATPQAWPAFAHLWTLSVEEQFYLVFPLLFLFLPRKTFVTMSIVLLIAAPMIRLLVSRALSGAFPTADPNWLAYAIYAASFTQFDAFLMGVLVALFEGRIRADATIRRGLYTAAVLALATYAAIYASLNIAGGTRGLDIARNILSGTMYGQGREVWVYSVVDLCCLSVVILSLVNPTARKVFGTPILSSIGRVSYGAYVFHASVLWMLATYVMPRDFEALRISERLPWFALAWVLTMGMAVLSFHYFEQPVIRWSRSAPRQAAQVAI